MDQKEIIKLRHLLHQNPELSNQEFETSNIISDFITKLNPSEVIKLSKTGKAFVFKGKEDGSTVVFRSELDALPIAEKTELAYTSINKQVAHSCGHDGHMAIISGLASEIAKNPPLKGKAVVLFQPAEEMEQGAKDIIEDPAFQKIEPDYIFALHNIPGAEKHTILIKKGSFSAASKGMTIKLIGKTSHAAEPEMGLNPAMAISKIIQELDKLKTNQALFKDLILLTIIHIRLGEIAFGTSPGDAEVMITLRAFENEDMELLTEHTENIIRSIAKNEQLELEITYNEIFPATVNDDYCVGSIEQAAAENNFKIEYMENPYKWSEDFGYYTEKYKGGFLGLGAGIKQPALHNADYDFPDDIIKTGINLFYTIYKNILT
jgi:amidohydrolase